MEFYTKMHNSQLSRFFFGLYAAAIIGASSAVAAGTPIQPASVVTVDKTTGCTLKIPQSWGSKIMTWSGGCKNKLADGNGVARILSGGKVVTTWYGDVKTGMPDFGVKETTEGREMGRFANGNFIDTDEYYNQKNLAPGIDPVRKAMVDALSRGSAAAKALGDKFEKSGNKASAAYYRKKAEEIDGSLD
jgi:hypothetical protein